MNYNANSAARQQRMLFFLNPHFSDQYRLPITNYRIHPATIPSIKTFSTILLKRSASNRYRMNLI